MEDVVSTKYKGSISVTALETARFMANIAALRRDYLDIFGGTVVMLPSSYLVADSLSATSG
jgi:hypothetical protein